MTVHLKVKPIAKMEELVLHLMWGLTDFLLKDACELNTLIDFIMYHHHHCYEGGRAKRAPPPLCLIVVSVTVATQLKQA